MLQQQQQERGRRFQRLNEDNTETEVIEENTDNATLMKNPRTLEVLWREYKFGVDRRKPAEHFTIAERNNQRTKQN